MEHYQGYVIPSYLDLDSRTQCLETKKVHHNNLKYNLTKRLEKAKSEGNKTLIVQLESEWQELFYDESLPI